MSWIKNNLGSLSAFFTERYPILVIFLISITFICGCISVPSSPKSTSPGIADTTPLPQAIVSVKARSFDPAIITIKAGTTITWTNEDPMMHRVVHLPEVNRPELFNSGPLSSGQSFSYLFREKGRYAYGDPQIGVGRSYLVIVE
jgi:plastocyanin